MKPNTSAELAGSLRVPGAPPAPGPGRLREAWYTLRDRLLQDRRFHRFATWFPLTRPIAQKRTRELFDLVAGFVYSQALHALVETRIIEHVGQEPRTLAEIASLAGMPLDSARRLVAAGVALRLLTPRSANRYGPGDLGAALLGNPGVIAMVRHHATLYRDLADPVGLLQRPDQPTELSRYWAYADPDKPQTLGSERVDDYSALMGISQTFVAEEILNAYPIRQHRRLLDVGGGEGAFAKAAAERAPALDLTVFDLPAVASRANAAFQTAGLSTRARATGGDLFADDLPIGADVISLVRVLYDHPLERVRIILKKAFAALPAGGTLLVAEPMADAPGAETVGAAYFGFYLLAMKGGDARSPGEIMQLLQDAGFEAASVIKTRNPLLTGLIVAKKPA